MGGLRLGVLAGAVVVLLATPPERPLAPVTTVAAVGHHAAVIVDTGETVKKVCVTFSEDQISGAEALRRAQVDAVFSSYGGRGEAVCSICGVGCPAGDCFCDARRFWAYHRAEPGGGYTFSRSGASTTVVRDGDVEGWSWGSGAPPPYVSVGQVCGIAEPAPRSSASPPSPSPTTTQAVAPATTAAPAPPAPAATTPAPPGDAPAPQSAATAPPAPEPEPGPTLPVAGDGVPPEAGEGPPAGDGGGVGAGQPRPAGAERAAGPGSERGAGTDGPSPFALGSFTVLLGGLLGWRRRLRRRSYVRRASDGS